MSLEEKGIKKLKDSTEKLIYAKRSLQSILLVCIVRSGNTYSL